MRAGGNSAPSRRVQRALVVAAFGPSPAPRRILPITVCAGVLACAVTVPFVVRAVSTLAAVRAGVLDDVPPNVRAFVPAESFPAAMEFSAVTLLVLSAWAIAIGAGVLLRRPWAREAGLLTFTVFACTLPLSLAGAFSRPPARSAWVGVAVALVDGLIVALLARRKTGEDIEAAAWARYARRRGLHVPSRWLGRVQA